MRNTTARRSRNRLAPRVKVWLEIDGSYVFGHGISEILKAIEQAGSMKQAAASLGKSYRYVWKRVKEAEKALGETLVETQVGGKDDQRSALSGLARTLVRDFDRLRAKMVAVLAVEFQGSFQALRSRG